MNHAFPKKHIVAAAFIGTLLVIVLALSPSSNVNATRIPIEITLPTENNTSPSLSEPTQQSEVTTNKSLTIIDKSKNENWHSFNIKSGDTLSDLFMKAGFNDKQMYKVIYSHSDNKQLTRIFPGEQIAFLSDDKNELEKIKLVRSPVESSLFTRNDSGKFYFSKVSRQPDIHISYSEGTIDSSLFLAGQKAGLAESQIMELANIFGWDIDFILDIREDDKFNLIYEELYLDGEKYKNGKILAANFTNQGKTFSAVLYDEQSGSSNYFTPNGVSMRKAFIRTPVDFARISSHFNLKRKHPILHKIRAHRGTDYAASYGTPIRATGDGKVINARNKGGYGRTVIIQHGSKITTLYAHLSKYARGVKEGRRVKQGQVIGYIGSSGLASGPHLHYEFRVNGVHKNPLKVKLPHAQPISKAQLARFRLYTDKYLAQLATFSESYQLAANP
ncbi:MAG: murein DD-endopeptidase MepM/ murein hydrolase activator NlpD [Oleiphilaceae bacterium]